MGQLQIKWKKKYIALIRMLICDFEWKNTIIRKFIWFNCENIRNKHFYLNSRHQRAYLMHNFWPQHVNLQKCPYHVNPILLNWAKNTENVFLFVHFPSNRKKSFKIEVGQLWWCTCKPHRIRNFYSHSAIEVRTWLRPLLTYA